MKILFLDIDGVLIPSGKEGFSPQCLENLQKIHQGCHPSIILSSSWRAFPSKISKINQALARYGIPEIAGKTELLGLNRSLEIVRWIDDRMEIDRFFKGEGGGGRPITDWAVLDDMDLVQQNREFKGRTEGHFVLVDPSVGLDSFSAQRVIRILGGS